MKDTIEKILNEKLVVSGSGMSVWGKKEASDELTALMCYREVRAYLYTAVEDIQRCWNILGRITRTTL